MQESSNADDVLVSAKGVLCIMLDAFVFPRIDEVKAFKTCKRKISYLCHVLAKNGYCKSNEEIWGEIKKIKTKAQLRECAEKMSKFLTAYDIKEALENS